MIDRTQLTEALAYAEDAIPAGIIDPLLEAARLLLDFPTDEQVEAIGKAIYEASLPTASFDKRGHMVPWEHSPNRELFRAAGREAVTMIGDTDA
jgi:hypothetical protein